MKLRIGFFLALLAAITFTGHAEEGATTMNENPEADDLVEQDAAPTEIRRGLRVGGEEGRSRTQIYYERIIELVEPDLQGKPERLAHYIRHFERASLPDANLFAFSAEAEYVDGTVKLTGYAHYEEMRSSLETYLGFLGFENIDNQLEVLPSENLGDEKYAIIKVPATYAYSRAEEPRERETTQYLFDFVFLLREAENGYFLAQTSEGYVGYIDGEHLHRIDAEVYERTRNSPKATFLRDHKEGDIFIPAGARPIYLTERDDFAMVLLPDANFIPVPRDIIEVRENEASERALAAIETARTLMGTPYKWGGKTTDGVDCSGLTYTAFRSQGINIPRDAYMQAYTGTLVGTRWNRDAMLPGDLVFFISNTARIHHVGIYLGDGRYLEATSPVATITSMNPDHEEYSERRDRSFAFAKRVVE